MSRRRLALVATLVLTLGSVACSGDGDPAATAGSAGSTAGPAGRRPLAGFDEATFRVTTGEGEVFDWCALLAATEAARQQGLMGQDDLRGYDAMLFRFDAPTTAEFYMYRTTLPLSIAWFDDGGSFVSSADMAPCPAADGADCPRHGADRPYRHALEVEEGGLSRLGVGPGATLAVRGDGCD